MQVITQFIYQFYLDKIRLSFSAPGPPRSLRIVSVDVTNITIQWDRVDCQDRNGNINGYRIIYFPISNPIAQTVSGTRHSDRMLHIVGLPPQTNYTFEIQAINLQAGLVGVPTTTNVSTTAPQSINN